MFNACRKLLTSRLICDCLSFNPIEMPKAKSEWMDGKFGLNKFKHVIKGLGRFCFDFLLKSDSNWLWDILKIEFCKNAINPLQVFKYFSSVLNVIQKAFRKQSNFQKFLFPILNNIFHSICIITFLEPIWNNTTGYCFCPLCWLQFQHLFGNYIVVKFSSEAKKTGSCSHCSHAMNPKSVGTT